MVDSMATGEKKTRTRKKQVLVTLSDKQLKQAEKVIAESLKDNPELFNLPESRYTVDGLVDFFVQSLEGSRKILPKEKRRYVIYLRKSTDDERKQVRSIDDQRKECLDLAKRLGIHVRPGHSKAKINRGKTRVKASKRYVLEVSELPS